MSLNLFFKGLLIGFSIAAPVGPIGVLCIRRSLAFGRAIGFVTGLGAATDDALYGCVAGFGLTAISSFLVGHRFWLAILGGLFLCYLGIRTFAAHPVETEKAPGRSNAALRVSVCPGPDRDEPGYNPLLRGGVRRFRTDRESKFTSKLPNS